MGNCVRVTIRAAHVHEAHACCSPLGACIFAALGLPLDYNHGHHPLLTTAPFPAPNISHDRTRGSQGSPFRGASSCVSYHTNPPEATESPHRLTCECSPGPTFLRVGLEGSAGFCKQGFSSLTCNRRPPWAAEPSPREKARNAGQG